MSELYSAPGRQLGDADEVAHEAWVLGEAGREGVERQLQQHRVLRRRRLPRPPQPDDENMTKCLNEKMT